MARFVPDIKTQRWIVITPARLNRPHVGDKGEKKSNVCPFCVGNEKNTPPEIFRMGKGVKDEPGWWIRVIPNKFPISDIHEVIIHSPDHIKDIDEFSVSHIEMILDVYRSRFKVHRDDGQVIIFCNHGETAGASLVHPHTQLVVIPRQINLDALAREAVMNVVEDNKSFVSYCPDFSQWPYEVWIASKKDDTMFCDISDEEIKDLAPLLKKTLQRLKKKHEEFNTKTMSETKEFAYNFYIHHGRNWFIRIIPRLIHRAGFELGTGLSVNVVDPTLAAVELASIDG